MINYQELKKIGLSDKEAKLYLTSLSRGPETAPNLAKLSAIVRPTAYVIIDALIKKGLMSSYDQDKKTYFTAESPEHLLSLLRLQKKELDESEREIIKLIPELTALSNIKGEKPKVRVFEGKEGLKTVIESILKSKVKTISGITPVDSLFGLFPRKEHGEYMASPRVQKKIKARLIYTSSEGPIYREKDPANLRDSLYINEKEFPFKGGVDIYGNNVAFYSYRGNIMGVIIENEDIAQTMQTVFDMIWKKYEKK